MEKKKKRKVHNCKSRRLEGEIVELLKKKVTYREIGEIVGLNPSTIQAVATRTGLNSIGMRKPERNEEIIQMLLDGEKYHIIAEKYGITKQRVYELASKNGIRRWSVPKKKK